MTDQARARHDFNNQLTVIRGFAEVLLEDAAADDPRRPDLVEIYNAAVNALALLARLYPLDSGRPS